MHVFGAYSFGASDFLGMIETFLVGSEKSEAYSVCFKNKHDNLDPRLKSL